MMSARVETVLPEDSLAHHPLPKKRPSELRPSHSSMTACSRQHRQEARPTSRISDLAVEQLAVWSTADRMRAAQAILDCYDHYHVLVAQMRTVSSLVAEKAGMAREEKGHRCLRSLEMEQTRLETATVTCQCEVMLKVSAKRIAVAAGT
jgi:hypothetical protein